MNAFVFLSLLASLTVGQSETSEYDPEKGLESWNQLKRDAGYYTESGIWRGGHWKKERYTNRDDYHCHVYAYTHCTGWCKNGVDYRTSARGCCTCSSSSPYYCNAWSCYVPLKTDSETFTNEMLECLCTSVSSNGRYCTEWSCGMTHSQTGDSNVQNFHCLVEAVNGRYCQRWKGDTSVGVNVQSAVCKCIEATGAFCQSWACVERGLPYCSSTSPAACNIALSIGAIGTTASIFAFGFGILVLTRFANNTSKKSLTYWIIYYLICLLFAVIFAALALEVADSGGLFGVISVSAMVTATLIFLRFCIWPRIVAYLIENNISLHE